MKVVRPRSAQDAATPQSNGRLPWHAIPTEEAIAARNGVQGGLSDEEASERLAQFGPNRLAPPKVRGPLIRFLAHFNNLLIYVLLAAAALTAALGHWTDTTVILAVAIFNAVIGFVQEGKAEKALQAIKQMLSPRATVLRNGQRKSVPAKDLVPGDLVLLEPGDKVPADIRLTRVKGLRVQEAAITGESVPVDKSIEPVSADAPLGDRASMAYAGTLVAAGQGSGIVVAIIGGGGSVSGGSIRLTPLTTRVATSISPSV